MLPQSFYNKQAAELAKALLGCVLVNESANGVTEGLIVETEAYTQQDAASHSFRGETQRTKAMFGPPGHAYVYFTYGMHYCFNVVSGAEGHGQGVLIRALEPVKGIELMKQRRNKDDVKKLCNGPAKLVQAMDIGMKDYGKPLFDSTLYIEGPATSEIKIKSGPRVGITQAKDVPWRFWIDGNPHVSR